MTTSRNYKDLQVWQRSLKLCTDVYEATRQFPKDEIFGITSQMRRAAVSIPSNIAEGQVRSSQAFSNYLSIAIGSAAELETQLMIAYRIGYLAELECTRLTTEITEIIRMLRALMNAIGK